MNEIGSEFWISKDSYEPISTNTLWSNWPGDKQFFVSGRTALSAILDDILVEHEVNKAYLPSYCCHTMIEPFIRHGFSVEFYEVACIYGSLQVSIDCNRKCDIILIMDYFGFSRIAPSCPSGAIVIRDMTHTLFLSGPKIYAADYLFASFRKWDAVAGAAIATKAGGRWNISCPELEHSTYIAIRNKAYKLKSEFVMGTTINKQEYIDLFNNAETLLENDYVGYCADFDSLCRVNNYFSKYIDIRKDNAMTLLSGLNDISIVEPVFTEIGPNDVPLFIPILVKNEQRDALRQYLICNSVYCPIHWPLSRLHTITAMEKLLYDQEISLVCDHRYNKTAMWRQLNVIRDFEEKNA